MTESKDSDDDFVVEEVTEPTAEEVEWRRWKTRVGIRGKVLAGLGEVTAVLPNTETGEKAREILDWLGVRVWTRLIGHPDVAADIERLHRALQHADVRTQSERWARVAGKIAATARDYQAAANDGLGVRPDLRAMLAENLLPLGGPAALVADPSPLHEWLMAYTRGSAGKKGRMNEARIISEIAVRYGAFGLQSGAALQRRTDEVIKPDHWRALVDKELRKSGYYDSATKQP